MDARLQLRVQRYGWDRAAPSYELAWKQALEPATVSVISQFDGPSIKLGDGR